MQNAQTLFQQAYQQHRNGALAAAETLYLQALAQQADHADALHLLGLVYYQLQQPQRGVPYIAKALALQPRNLDYLNNHGLVLRAAGELEGALKSFQQAILLQPKDLDVQLNLANTLLGLSRFDEAATYYRRLLRAADRDDIKAALVHCLSSIGNTAQTVGDYAQATNVFKEAITLAPSQPDLHYNLANAQRELGQSQEALSHYQKALQYNPNDADGWNNLGNVQRELGQLDMAIASYERALQVNPQLYHAKVHLVHQKQHICDWRTLEQDIAQIRSWVVNKPEAQVSPFAFLAMPGTTPQEQKICADHWVQQRYAALFAANESDAHSVHQQKDKIRIGYLSADFRLHPLAFLISELIELHDRAHFEIVAFSYGNDDKTPARQRLEKAFDAFHDIRGLTDQQAVDKIRASGIDILVDLSGFTQTSRSGIVALKPASVHVNWLGFPGTMGSFDGKALFDYLLTDAFITPDSQSKNYAEKLVKLPHGYQPNDRLRPVGKVPSRAECGLPDKAFVFCSFNQTFKITPDVFVVWMRLLEQVADSVLWLLDCNRWAKQNLLQAAADAGIAPERLVFAPRVALEQHLARHAHADLFLDTQPYNAHTTCSDALWMGLPVLTCTGDTFASRVAGSLLHNAGLPELITDNLADYEALALKLTSDVNHLQALKDHLQNARTEARLFDTAQFARALESAYREMLGAA